MPPQITPPDNELYEFVCSIVAGDTTATTGMLRHSPALVHARCVVGATRQDPDPYFFEAIAHYMYAGDTALHMAAAAHRSVIAQALIDEGADCSAANRRGAHPLHYAADANAGHLDGQAAVIASLVRAGADPNATDRSGVAPLHRAVRTRSAAAVEALLAAGAAPRGRNAGGSTPLHLAVRNTGASNSGTPHAVERQRKIIELLLKAGAHADDKDANGTTVRDAARSGWIRELL